MVLKKISILFILILASLSVVSQNAVVKISGTASSFPGKRVKLCQYADQISYTEKIIATTKTDTSGRFTFSLPLKEVVSAYIYVDNIKSLVYLEPGQQINLKFPSREELIEMESQSSLHSLIPIEVPVEFDNIDTTSLNYLIGEYNYLYNDFVANHYNELRNARNKTLINALRESTKKSFGYSSNSYFREYVRYREASMELWQKVKSDSALVVNYLDQHKPDWENTEYMYFFNQMYNKYFLKKAKKVKGDSIQYYVNDAKSYSGLIRILASDSILLPNDTLREMVLLKGLYEASKVAEFKKEGIVVVLKYIQNFSHIARHRDIAESLINAITRFEPGYPCSNFSLKDFEGNVHSSDEFKGKMTYLVFWNTWNISCMNEMAMIDTLSRQFTDKINFVAICCDEDYEKAKKQITTFKLAKWTHLYASDYRELIESYGVSSFPSFMLLDDNFKILYYPARKPSEKLSEQLWQIILKKEADIKNEKERRRIEEINNEKKSGK